ncbi:histidine phosphatase family protein [Pseudactinotalea sp.]|uniref:histidine phosphatase family protein n=1 Tax=Pseudactinotalea sp. TaxID=1926260 RepID=UPI003B3B4EA4
MSEILLARHGRTAWHSGNRYTGASDLDIDSEGETQAARLGRWAGGQGLSALAATSLRRTQSTAAAVAEVTGLRVDLLPELREIDFGIAEGRTMTELRGTHPAEAAAFERDPVSDHWPGGDDPRARTTTALAALGDWAASLTGRGMLVCHSTMIRLLVCEVLGVPLSEYRRRLPRLDPVAVTALHRSGTGTWALLRYNVPPEGAHDGSTP